MAIVLSCECGRKLQVKEEFAGQEGKCPACGRTMLIPEGDVPAEPVYGALPVEEAAPDDATRVEPPAPAPDEPPAPEQAEPVTDHGGGRLPRDADFFAGPPAEIGRVLSAHTTLAGGRRPWTAGGRLVAAGLFGLAGLAVGAVIVLVATPRNEFWQFLWPTLGSVLGAALTAARTRFAHTCTYVGRDGVARFTCSGSRDRVTGSEVFRFRDATELRTSQTLRYVNGSYQGTNYTFTWTDVGGRPRYSIAGTHHTEKGTPPSGDAFHYARAAEMAWTVYLLGQAPRQLELNGSVPFNLKGGQSVRLAQGVLTLQLGGDPVEWPADDIDAILVEKGVVKIKRKDAAEGWFSSTGVTKFPFDSLANAQLFFHLVDRLLGVRIG